MTDAANDQPQSPTLNGLSLGALTEVVEQISSDPSRAVTAFRVQSEWRGGAKVESKVSAYELGGRRIAREHVMRSDEPRELFGEDSAPNPQELLFAALNGCMIFGYAAKAAALGIEVERIAVETHGSLDIRGALGLAEVPPGMDTIHYTVRIKADATAEQLDALHRDVMAHSPNRYHLSHPIRLAPKLVIE